MSTGIVKSYSERHGLSAAVAWLQVCRASKFVMMIAAKRDGWYPIVGMREGRPKEDSWSTKISIFTCVTRFLHITLPAAPVLVCFVLSH